MLKVRSCFDEYWTAKHNVSNFLYSIVLANQYIKKGFLLADENSMSIRKKIKFEVLTEDVFSRWEQLVEPKSALVLAISC